MPTSTWIDIALTALLSLITALALTALHAFFNRDLAVVQRFYFNLVYALSIGFCIHFLHDLFRSRIRAWLAAGPFIARLLADMALWLCGAFLGYLMASVILDRD
ncbi:MAG TPA: hypothetical protein VFX76_17715, partial [Roseiflexaceae bacterium]|nr:hypothetical protein [Roseiflexaceae bacterium]